MITNVYTITSFGQRTLQLALRCFPNFVLILMQKGTTVCFDRDIFRTSKGNKKLLKKKKKEFA